LVAVPALACCQLHKIRNVRDKLPQRLRPIVGRRMCAAYHAEAVPQAEGLLTELARELDTAHPSAAASLREGLPETLTVLRLGVPTLARTLRSTNANTGPRRSRQAGGSRRPRSTKGTKLGVVAWCIRTYA